MCCNPRWTALPGTSSEAQPLTHQSSLQMFAGDSRAPADSWQAAEHSPCRVVSIQLLLSYPGHAGSTNGVPTVCQAQCLALRDWVGTSQRASLHVPDIFKALLLSTRPVSDGSE